MRKAEVKKTVRERYAKVAGRKGCCSDSSASGCGSAEEVSKRLGYSEKELKSVPEGANLGLGCGNPVALASLRGGQTVLDLGSGPGLDCFLAAQKVGKKGRVIGVDMTPEMIDKARESARKGKHKNVEFRLGEIENLPVADGAVDVVMSNCVINLSPDKKRVFEEALRVLRPGGRLMVSDLVLLKELPKGVRRNADAYVGCVSGAMLKREYIEAIRKAGFREVKIMAEKHFPVDCCVSGAPAAEIAESVVSIQLCGLKPVLRKPMNE